jgi:hypothetical protein
VARDRHLQAPRIAPQGFAIDGLSAHLDAMPRKELELPPAVVRAFVKDMHAFFAATTGLERDEIAARQLHALREHLRPGEKLRLADVHEMFEQLKDHQ